jgi:hypothetical protein
MHTRIGLINTGRRQKIHEKQGVTTIYETASNHLRIFGEIINCSKIPFP